MAEILQPHLSKLRVPKGGDKVYKDECIYSFDSPVNFKTFIFNKYYFWQSRSQSPASEADNPKFCKPIGSANK